jgi:hypothetical protein
MMLVEWLRFAFPRATALIEPHRHVLGKAVRRLIDLVTQSPA